MSKYIVELDDKDKEICEQYINGKLGDELDDYANVTELAEAIANGTPLPKGHGRLLDVNDLVASLEKDTREAFTKHQVWLKFSVYNKDVPTIVEAD